MYKKSLRYMPRSIKKEIVQRLAGFDSISDIIPISESNVADNEKYVINILSRIKGLPNYWLISSINTKNSYYIVFESILTKKCEEEIFSDYYLEDDLFRESESPYYGIY